MHSLCSQRFKRHHKRIEGKWKKIQANVKKIEKKFGIDLRKKKKDEKIKV